MRFFDKEARAEAKIAAQAEAMTKKVDPGGTLSSTWQNEAASYRTSGGGSTASGSSWVADLAYEQPELLDRPSRGRRAIDVDASPARRGPDRRPVYQPERLFDIRGIFGATRENVFGQRDAARWPNETRPYQPRPGGGCSCGSPGCPG